MGYAGGTQQNPTYHNLGDHTESLQVDFDPTRISYRELLELFWKGHTPTSRAWSRQYMAAVFTHDAAQRRAAEESKAALEASLGRTVQTQILPAGPFTLAEDYHQKYYLRQDRELLREFTAIYPSAADLVNSTAAARANGYAVGEGEPRQRAETVGRLGLSERARQRLLQGRRGWW